MTQQIVVEGHVFKKRERVLKGHSFRHGKSIRTLREEASEALERAEVDVPRVVGTYDIISPTVAVIKVTYPDGRFGMERVEVNYPSDLYEAAYSAASVKADIHGCELGQFRPA